MEETKEGRRISHSVYLAARKLNQITFIDHKIVEFYGNQLPELIIMLVIMYNLENNCSQSTQKRMLQMLSNLNWNSRVNLTLWLPQADTSTRGRTHEEDVLYALKSCSNLKEIGLQDLYNGASLRYQVDLDRPDLMDLIYGNIVAT